MSTLLDLFYRALLYLTRLEIALALKQPERNYTNLVALQRDESEYERALTRLLLNL